MTDRTSSALGLSVGATQLTAVTASNAVCRTPVLTLFGHRPPQLGLPSHSANPDERGLTIGDFVDRIGDPIPIMASDGSSHRSETLLADALRALAYTATGGRPLPEVTALSYPAHWRPAAVDALRRALAQVPEWSRKPVSLLPDVTAALTALHDDPGLPSRGVIVFCDFGGSGTSLTLVDASGGNRPIGPVERHVDFSGDLVDQALLSQVIGDLADAGSVDLVSTSAIGSLTRLRTQCRAAKERLSDSAVTTMPVELPGYRGDIRLTRNELDDAVRAPLYHVVDIVRDMMWRNGIRPVDLAAVATVGGGARMAAVTTALSEQLRVPVITTPRPALSAAIGAARRALRGPADDRATAMAPAAPATAAAAVVLAFPDRAPLSGALAWSQADDLPGLDPAPPGRPGSPTSARPQIDFEEHPAVATTAARPVRWYRSPLVLMAAAIVLSVGTISAIGVVLAGDAMTTPASTPTPSIATTPGAPAPAIVAQPPATPHIALQEQDSAPAPDVRTITAIPAPVTRTRIVMQPAPPPAAPPPPVTETVTETPPPSETVPPSAEAPAPTPEPPVQQTPPPPTTPPRWLSRLPIPPIPAIPGLPPFVPQPVIP